MPVPTILRSLLLLFWLTSSVTAQNAPTPPNNLTVPGLPQQAPPPSVVDTVNLFRHHQQQQTQLDEQLTQLAANYDIDLWLVTVSFQTKQSAAQEAAAIVSAWSGERPAIVLIYIRGKRATGVAANSSLQEIVPAFELAGTLPASEDASSPPGPDFAPDTEGRVNSLVETTQKLVDLIRRYTKGESLPDEQGAVGTNQEKIVTDPVATAAAASPASSRHAESLLLIAVLVVAALIVWFTARTST